MLFAGVDQATLFSAHAEVFPKKVLIHPPLQALLRTRGGVSTLFALLEMKEFSPH